LSRQVKFDRFVVDFFSTKSIHKKKELHVEFHE